MEETTGLLSQLGIDWKLFLSQAANFFILLLILRSFVYKPLFKAIKERNKKIQEGLTKAEEAAVRLQEVDHIAKEKLQEADQESINIIQSTKEKAKGLGEVLAKEVEQKRIVLMQELSAQHKKQEEDSKKAILKQAGELVKKVLIKTVELKPDQVDEALIKKAISTINEPR